MSCLRTFSASLSSSHSNSIDADAFRCTSTDVTTLRSYGNLLPASRAPPVSALYGRTSAELGQNGVTRRMLMEPQPDPQRDWDMIEAFRRAV